MIQIRKSDNEEVDPWSDRIETHTAVSTELAGASDSQLRELVESAEVGQSGIGGSSVRLTVAGRLVFVKLVPLSALEMRPGNHLSTANIFALPTYFQYGIGSVGFGAWRELRSHVMATHWVLSRASPNFPLMHHWRVIPGLSGAQPADDEPDYFASGATDLPGVAEIRARIESTRTPQAHLVLFLEYFPQTLLEWLRDRLVSGGEPADHAIRFVDQSLERACAFMAQEGFVHFDMHFRNILTDGREIYLSDFGLASCERFDLDDKEREFLRAHADYDPFRSSSALVQCIVNSLGNGGPWETHLSDPAFFAPAKLSDAVRAVLEKHSPLALAMREFSLRLKNESKLTRYPGRLVCALLAARAA